MERKKKVDNKQQISINISINELFYWLFIFYIIGNTLQLLVNLHSWIGEAELHDGFYSTYIIMTGEAFLYFFAALYNFFMLFVTLAKHKYRLWIIPAINTIGLIIVIVSFIIQEISYEFNIYSLEISAYPIYNTVKFCSIIMAIYICIKLKRKINKRV